MKKKTNLFKGFSKKTINSLSIATKQDDLFRI